MAKAATATAVKPKAPVPAGTPSLKMVEFTAGNTKQALAGLEAGRGTMHMIAPSKLRVMPGFNVRVHDTDDYQNDLRELTDSIKSEGFYTSKPITGFVGKDGDEDVIFVADGHRRLEATRLAISEGAEIAQIPVVLREKASTIDLTIALVRENTGRKLTFLENAIVVRRLITGGVSEDDLVKRLPFSKMAISQFIMLIKAPKSIRNAVRENRITGTEAVRILAKKECREDPKKAEDMVADMIAKAEARGKKTATRKDSGDAPVRRSAKNSTTDEGDEPEEKANKIEMSRHAFEWTVGAGQEFKLEEITHFKGLAGDSDWYEADPDKAGWAKAVEDFEIKGYIRRPKKEEAPPVKEEVEGEAEPEAEAEGEADEADGGDL